MNAAIFDEMWLVKEGMRMYEGTLAASFDEEDSIEHRLARARVEIEQLEEKKRKLKQDIRDDVAKLLEKRRTLLELQDRQRTYVADVSNVHGDLKIARECRRKIEELWDNAREAAGHA
jgi:predicted  nucleic acid-binding Zn-ribbon protein